MFSSIIYRLCTLIAFASIVTALEIKMSWIRSKHDTVSICYDFKTQNSLLASPLSRRIQPKMLLSLPDTNYDDNVFINSDVLSLQDFKKINITTQETWSVHLGVGHANIGGSLFEDKPNQLYESVDEMVRDDGNEYRVLNTNLSLANGSTQAEYSVFQDGIYCARFRLNGGPERLKYNNQISIEEVQRYGRLNKFDFMNLVIAFYSWMAYSILFAWLSYHISRETKSDKSNATFFLIQPFYETSLIQFKILIYLFGVATVHFLEFLSLREQNIHGYLDSPNSFKSYDTFQILIQFFTILITVIFNVWAIYNFLLLSSGVFFGNPRKTRIVMIITGLFTIEYFIHQLFKHDLILQIVDGICKLLVFVLGSYWCFETYKQLKKEKAQILGKKLLITYGLMFIMLVTYTVIAETPLWWQVERTILDWEYETKVRPDFDLYALQACGVSHIFKFLITVFIVYIWKDVKFLNDTICMNDISL